MDDRIRAALCDMGHEDAVIFDGPDYDDAIVGVTDDGRVIYDYNKMVGALQTQYAWSEDEAIEYIEYNTIRSLAYAGDDAPIIMYTLNI